MERVILHSDANSFYASVSLRNRPELQHLPVAVAGDPKARHGIILARNQPAKQYGVRTAETIREALDKCPQLQLIPPEYGEYLRVSRELMELYESYTPKVEPYGLDEAWLDLSQPGYTLRDGLEIANEIRERVHKEHKITVSIGVSYNKIFAKLGSDLKKPDATTVISPKTYQQRIWNLPASDLLFVGRKTAEKLAKHNLRTIGDLAQADPGVLQWLLGKNGAMLQTFAQGRDTSPVQYACQGAAVKSISNSTTPPHDICTLEDARCLFYVLAESVAARLREQKLRTQCVSIQLRNPDLSMRSCQQTLPRPTANTGEIARTAIALYTQRFSAQAPFRGAGLHCASLQPTNTPEQLDFFTDHQKRQKDESLDRTIDHLRQRFGHRAVQRGVILTDPQYARINPHDDHVQPATPFYTG